MKHRLEPIDALRGVAAMLVLCQHVGELAFAPSRMTGGAADWWNAVAQILSPGKAGVIAFFAISGFVIPFSFRPVRPLSTFLISRFFRLYPAYWLSLACALVILPVFADFHFSLGQVVANITMIQTAFRQPDVLGVYWTLFIELIFYGVCFGAYCAGQRFGTRYLLAASAAFLVAAIGMATVRWFHPATAAPVAIPLGLVVMHLGALSRRAFLDADRLARRTLPIALALLCVAVPPICFLAYSGAGAQEPWLAVMNGYYLGFLLFAAALGSRALVNRTTLYLGKISYSLYLFHPLCMTVALFFAPKLVPWDAAPWLAIGLTVVASVAVSALTFRWIEQPSIAAGRALSGGAKPAAAI